MSKKSLLCVLRAPTKGAEGLIDLMTLMNDEEKASRWRARGTVINEISWSTYLGRILVLSYTVVN